MIRKTPLLAAPVLGKHCFLKYENLQTTGSFKIRGAVEALKRLVADGGKPDKVIAASAGNHGAGLAYAGREFGVPVELFVPESTPLNKCERMAGYGAVLHHVPGGYDASESQAKSMAKEQSVPYVSPYEDDAVIHGNGFLLGKEIHEQCPQVKTVVCPLGGGGMASGLGQYFQGKDVQMVGVSPINNCAMVTSLKTGIAQVAYHGKRTLAEGLEGSVSEKTYELCKQYGIETQTVTEEAIKDAIIYSFKHFATVLEASAAVVVAAHLQKEVSAKPGLSTVFILSGGNCDQLLLNELVS